MKFIIYGNHNDEKGNPLGYTRTTTKSKWSDKYQNYCAWKAHVVDAYLKATGVQTLDAKPIPKSKEKMYLHTVAYFADLKHPDPDNIQKGIADALFQSDKYLAGSYDFAYDKENPRVECTITP